MTESERAEESVTEPTRAPKRRITAVEIGVGVGVAGVAVGAFGIYFGLSRTIECHCPPATCPSAETAAKGAPSDAEEARGTFVLELGTPKARPHLVSGWGTAEKRDGRAVLPNERTTATARVPVAAGEAGALLTLVGRAAQGRQLMEVSVGERRIGQLLLDSSWNRGQVFIEPGVLQAGPNLVTFQLPKERSVWLEWFTIGPLPNYAEVVCSRPGSVGQLITGWGKRQSSGIHHYVPTRGRQSRVGLALQPSSGAYWLGVIARAPADLPAELAKIEVTVNGDGVGTCPLNRSWGACHLPLRAEQLRGGVNHVDFQHDSAPGADKTDGGSPPGAIQVKRVWLRPSLPSTQIDVGHPDDRAYLISGFTPDPPWGTKNSFVWSEGDTSQLSLPLASADRHHKLELKGFAFRPIAPVEVTVEVNGHPAVGTMSLGEKPKKHHLSIPPDQLSAGTNNIVLRYSKTGQPSKYSDESKDTRNLGIGLHAVRLAPSE